jgi:hypothetical protein
MLRLVENVERRDQHAQLHEGRRTQVFRKRWAERDLYVLDWSPRLSPDYQVIDAVTVVPSGNLVADGATIIGTRTAVMLSLGTPGTTHDVLVRILSKERTLDHTMQLRVI